jgi:DNA invertase Pin-like site-specific DNA recombinase
LKDGVKFGRKDVVDEDKEYQIYQLRSKGKSIRAIAKEVGISVGRTHKVCSSLSL